MKLALVCLELALATALVPFAVEPSVSSTARVIASLGCAVLTTIAFLIATDGRRWL